MKKRNSTIVLLIICLSLNTWTNPVWAEGGKESETLSSVTYLEKPLLPNDPMLQPTSNQDTEKSSDNLDSSTTSSPKVLQKNNKSGPLPWHLLNWGDIVLGRGKKNKLWMIPYGFYRHAGIWHMKQKKLISAKWPEGVYFESQELWNQEYSNVCFLTVPSVDLKTKKQITLYAENLIGKPYRLTHKTTLDSWYCSKILWVGYKLADVDIDSKNGYFATPDNIYRSQETKLIYYR